MSQMEICRTIAADFITPVNLVSPPTPIPKGAYDIFAVLTIDIYFHQASSRFWEGNKVTFEDLTVLILESVCLNQCYLFVELPIQGLQN